MGQVEFLTLKTLKCPYEILSIVVSFDVQHMNTHPDLSTHVNEKLITPFWCRYSLENTDWLVGMKVLSATPLEMGLAGALGLAAGGRGAPAAISGRAPCWRNIQPEPTDR